MSGLLHPESHFVDPKGGPLRRQAYRHLRRHWQHTNHTKLFEDVSDTAKGYFGIHVYGSDGPIHFLQMALVHSPYTIDGSLRHDGVGDLPGIMLPAGGWDLRPHADRVLTIDNEVLADWARLFDEPGTTAEEARLLRPVTRADLAALSVLADQPVRLADHEYHWSSGWHEKGAKDDGTIRWQEAVPDSWDEVILQGPHFTVATPFAKQPNENCKHNQDYGEWDLESLRASVIPRTNYQRACDRDTYDARLDHWNGRLATDVPRLAWRAMTQPGLERSLHATLLTTGSAHTGGVFSLALPRLRDTARCAGMWATLPLDFLVKVSGVANVKEFLVKKFPLPESHPLDAALILRTLRLNCLTADYSPLWEELFDEVWLDDGWTVDPMAEPELAAALGRVPLGDVSPDWTMATPLRRDLERRQALVELDAIAAIMLGLSAEQLCAMYRTQFAVLRKYEYKMAFDADGRKQCGYHQSAGYRQSQLQAQAKAGTGAAGDLPKDWSNLWKLYLQWEDDPAAQADPSFWRGHYKAPFTRPDREAEMTRAYKAFQARHAGPKA